jgi:hypothetical protein
MGGALYSSVDSAYEANFRVGWEVRGGMKRGVDAVCLRRLE